MEWKPDEIKALRQALGLTQAEFAKKFSLSQSLVAQWETGKKSPTEDFHKILEQLRKEIPTDLERCNVNTPGEIKALREALGLTRAELAKKLSISKRLVRYWETGIVCALCSSMQFLIDALRSPTHKKTFFPCQFQVEIL